MGKKTTSGDRLAIGGAVLALAAILFIADRTAAAWFVVLSLGVPYLALMFPFQCRELTRQGTACTSARRGWLIGCGQPSHRWRRLRRLAAAASGGLISSRAQPLGNASHRDRRPPASGASTSHQTASTPRHDPGRPLYDGMILITALISAVTGVIQIL